MMKEEEDYKDMAKKNAITKFTTFYNIVRNGSLMDLKNQPEWHHSHFIFREEVIDYDAPGNINYGYLGKIFAMKRSCSLMQVLDMLKLWQATLTQTL